MKEGQREKNDRRRERDEGRVVGERGMGGERRMRQGWWERKMREGLKRRGMREGWRDRGMRGGWRERGMSDRGQRYCSTSLSPVAVAMPRSSYTVLLAAAAAANACLKRLLSPDMREDLHYLSALPRGL